jgi:hypothetical protein
VEAPCDCRRHPGQQPPDGHSVEEHKAVIGSRQGNEALDGELPERREWLLAVAAMAMHIVHDAGVDHIAPTVFEQQFIGLDRSDDRRLRAS